MTLKVIRNANQWLLVGGVEEIWVIKHDPNKKEEPPVVDDSVRFIAKIMDDAKPGDKFTELLYRDDNDDWCTITFNTEAYLCNDFGKTVEKIYG